MTLFPHFLSGAKVLSLLVPTGLLGVGALGVKYPAYDIFRDSDKSVRRENNERKSRVSEILNKYKLTSADYTDELISTIFKSEDTGFLTEEHKNLGISLYLLSFKLAPPEKTLISIYDLINGNDTEGILLYKDLWNSSDLQKFREYKLGLGSYKYSDLGFKEFEVENWLKKIINTCNIQIKTKSSESFSREFSSLNKWEKSKLLIYLFAKRFSICLTPSKIQLNDGKWSIFLGKTK